MIGIVELRRLLISITCVVQLSTVAHAAPSSQAPECRGDGSRVALLVGNQTYSAPMQSLDNPHRDVDKFGDLLCQNGFSVFRYLDLNVEDFDQAIETFAAASHGAKTALVYYSGHGFAAGKKNWLIPTDAKLSCDDIVGEGSTAFRMTRHLVDLEEQLVARLDPIADQIVILDACRTEPIRGCRGTFTPTLIKGLGHSETAAGRLVLYATQDGQVALDSVQGSPNSPLMTALMDRLSASPHREWVMAMLEVAKSVARMTHQHQVPNLDVSVPPQGCLAPSCDPSPDEASDSKTKLLGFTSGQTNRSALGELLAYPDLVIQEAARQRLAALGTPSPDIQPGGSTDPEQPLRDTAEAVSMINRGQAYERGTETTRDLAEAAHWYQRAADVGSPTGIYDLARLYERGSGVTKDVAKAIDLYRRSASAGNSLAMYAIGDLYSTGLGVPKNEIAATAWYEKAIAAVNATKVVGPASLNGSAAALPPHSPPDPPPAPDPTPPMSEPPELPVTETPPPPVPLPPTPSPPAPTPPERIVAYAEPITPTPAWRPQPPKPQPPRSVDKTPISGQDGNLPLKPRPDKPKLDQVAKLLEQLPDDQPTRKAIARAKPVPDQTEQSPFDPTDISHLIGKEAPSRNVASMPRPVEAMPPMTAPIGVPQRAGLLVDAAEEPQKVKTYQGSVVWKSNSVSAGQGQPLSNAVSADIDIPDAKVTLSMVLKKNFERQFPASHTIEFHFAERPGNTLGPVKQINVPEMRRDDAAASGDPLIGVPVSITDDYFLVGLSRGEAEQTNDALLSQRNWVDLSILLSSGKIAKITFEKGPTGQKIIDDFFGKSTSAGLIDPPTRPSAKATNVLQPTGAAGSPFPEPKKVNTFLVRPDGTFIPSRPAH